uniref:Ubiquinone biosynthesis protein coq-8 n=1 Tax=Rhizophora mucronata TaxID=61149 RepID=A0A2P2M294_RHIMU
MPNLHLLCALLMQALQTYAFFSFGTVIQNPGTLFVLLTCNVSFQDEDQHAIILFQATEPMMLPLLC